MKPPPLELRIQQFVDGDLDDNGCEEMVALLKSDPRALKIYCRYSELDSSLLHIHSGPARLGAEQSTIAMRAQRRGIKRARRAAVLSAAAGIVALAVTLYLIFAREEPPMASFKTSPSSIYEIQHALEGPDTPESGTLAEGSRVILQKGHVELTFASGVRSVIQAPADLTLHTEDHLFLSEGTVWFHVPPKATGFRVRTKTLSIVDLGTEFGVHSSPDRLDEVHVFEGKVEVTNLNPLKHKATLVKGEARQAGPIGRLKPLPVRAEAFLTTLPTTPATNAKLLFHIDPRLLGSLPAGNRSRDDSTVGTEFTVGASDLLVTSLGMEDTGTDGLNTSHQVGIWEIEGGSLVASVTVPAGTGAHLIETWRFEPLSTPITLIAGRTYRIGGLTSTSDNFTDAGHSEEEGAADFSTSRVEFSVSSDVTLPVAPNRFSDGFGNPFIDGKLTPLRWAPANLEYTVIPKPEADSNESHP